MDVYTQDKKVGSFSEISFSTMAWRLGIRGEKIEEKRR